MSTIKLRFLVINLRNSGIVVYFNYGVIKMYSNGEDALKALYTETNEEDKHDRLRIYIKLKEVLHERKLTQKELAEMTGIRRAAISEIANNQRSAINKEHIEKIAEVLKITDLSELIVFELESELASMSHPYNQLRDK